jgi:hypothetical protein
LGFRTQPTRAPASTGAPTITASDHSDRGLKLTRSTALPPDFEQVLDGKGPDGTLQTVVCVAAYAPCCPLMAVGRGALAKENLPALAKLTPEHSSPCPTVCKWC